MQRSIIIKIQSESALLPNHITYFIRFLNPRISNTGILFLLALMRMHFFIGAGRMPILIAFGK